MRHALPALSCAPMLAHLFLTGLLAPWHRFLLVFSPDACPSLPQSKDTVEELAGSKGSAAVFIPLNPPLEEALLMREALLAKRAAAKAKKDSKKASRAAVVVEADASQPAADAVVITAHANGSGDKRRAADISVAAAGAVPAQQVSQD